MTVKRQVTATLPAKKDKEGKFIKGREKDLTATVTIEDGATAAEQIKMFGDEAVKTNAQSNWDVTVQAAIRRGLAAGKTQAQIATELATAKMGVKTVGAKVDPQQAFIAKFKSATPAEQAKMLAELKAAAQV